MNFIKKLLGLDKVEANIAIANQLLEEATAKKDEAEQALKIVQEQEEIAKLSPKDRATRKKEPWVGVLNTHVNKDNVRNGFFELDWNEPFVLKLKQEGYGYDGDKDEEIVDRWFRELCANVVVDGDFGGPINTGVIDINEVKRKNQTQ
jgi:hypothetical protein